MQVREIRRNRSGKACWLLVHETVYARILGVLNLTRDSPMLSSCAALSFRPDSVAQGPTRLALNTVEAHVFFFFTRFGSRSVTTVNSPRLL
jgi:hypothetical protein